MNAKSDPDAAADAALMVPVSTVAHILDLTPRRIQQLVADGVVPKAERGRYPLVAVVRAYLAHVRAGSEAPVGNLDPAQERARKDRALAISAEIKNDLAIGNVVPVEVAVTGARLQLTKLRTKLLGLPTRIAARVPGKVKPEVFALAETEVHQIMVELSEGPDMRVSLEEIGSEISK